MAARSGGFRRAVLTRCATALSPDFTFRDLDDAIEAVVVEVGERFDFLPHEARKIADSWRTGALINDARALL